MSLDREESQHEPATRRFLLTAVISRYHYQPSWDRPDLVDDLHRVVRIFTSQFGYVHVPVMGLDPTWLQIQDAIRDFCTDPARRPSDYLVVYIAGHGEIIEEGEPGAQHVILPADTLPKDLRRRTIKSGDLAEWLLAETVLCRVLLIVDACFSGQGALDFTRNALTSIGRPTRFDGPGSTGVVVVSATQPAEEAIPGAFLSGFERALTSQATAGYGPPDLNIGAIIAGMKADPRMPKTQQARWSLLLGNGHIPEFLPNARQASTLLSLDLLEQDRQWDHRREQESRRYQDLTTKFLPKTHGFLGREQVLRRIANWLDGRGASQHMLLTGDPGSGKSAVLGVVAAFSDPERRPTLPRSGFADDTVPEESSVDAAIYAGNMTTAEVIVAVASAASLGAFEFDAHRLDATIARLCASLRHLNKPLTVLLDALDEAADPHELAARVLRPLMERPGSLRLLIGARRDICDSLGREWRGQCELVDLDAPGYVDPQSLRRVVDRTLRSPAGAAGERKTASPFLEASTAAFEGAVDEISEAADRSFFLARLLGQTQVLKALTRGLPDPTDEKWRSTLSGDASDAIRDELEARFGAETRRAIDLLVPLAYATGGGMPWEDLWASLASALSANGAYTNEDLLWLKRRGGSYVVETRPLGNHSLYRLYHQSLVEFLRKARDEVNDERRISEVLCAAVPKREGGRPDWTAAHAYTRAHLAHHARRGRVLERLVQDPGFLLAASPSALLAALDGVSTDNGRRLALAYRRALPMFRRAPSANHASHLELAARQSGVDDLADAIETGVGLRPWGVNWVAWGHTPLHHKLVGHAGWVNAVLVREDGGAPTVLSASDDGTIRGWNLLTGLQVMEPILASEHPVNALAFGRIDDKDVLLAGGDDKRLIAWDLASHQRVGAPFEGHTGWIRSIVVASSKGGDVAVSASEDGSLRVWDLGSGRTLGEPLQGPAGPVRGVAIGWRDGRPVLVSSSDDATIRVWDLDNRRPSGQDLTGHTAATWPVAIGAVRGRAVVVSGSYDTTLRVWDLESGDAVGLPLVGHTGAIWAIATGHLGGRPVAVSGSADTTVRVWDLEAQRQMGSPLTGHSDWVNAVALAHQDGQDLIVSGSADRTVRVWDPSASTSAPPEAHIAPVLTAVAAETSDGWIVITGSADTTVRTWSPETGMPSSDPLTGHQDWVRCLATVPDQIGTMVVSGSDDGSVRAWDVSNSACWGRPMMGHAGPVHAISGIKSQSGPRAISGGADGALRIWDLRTSVAVGDATVAHTGPVWAPVVVDVADRIVLVSAGDDRQVRSYFVGESGLEPWETFELASPGVAMAALPACEETQIAIGTEGGQIVRLTLTDRGGVANVFAETPSAIRDIEVTRSGQRVAIAVGSSDGVIRLIDAASGEISDDAIACHGGEILTIAAVGDPDSPSLFVSTQDCPPRLWRTDSGSPSPRQGATAPGAVFALAKLAANGGWLLATGGSDTAIRLWDSLSGEPVGDPMTGHNGPVWSLAAHTDDGQTRVISGGDDGTLRSWQPLTAGSQTITIPAHEGPVRCVATGLGQAGVPVAVSGSADRSVRRWNIRTGEAIGDPLIGHSDGVRCIAIHLRDNEPEIISGDESGYIRTWWLGSGLPSAPPIHLDTGAAVLALATAQWQGRNILIAGDAEGYIHAYDLGTQEPLCSAVRSGGSKVGALTVVGSDGQARQSALTLVSAVDDSLQIWPLGADSTPLPPTFSASFDIGATLLAMAAVQGSSVAVGTESGLVVITISEELTNPMRK